jgi:hypothetical protein
VRKNEKESLRKKERERLRKRLSKKEREIMKEREGGGRDSKDIKQDNLKEFNSPKQRVC